MAPEGMVHALEILHHLLKADGLLIDIHPSSEPPSIYVRHPGGDMPVGRLQETDDFIEYNQANQAMEQAVLRQWFRQEEQSEFIFTIHAGNLEELISFLAAEWKDAILPQDTAAKIQAFYQESDQEKEIIINEKILIARYRQGDPT
jgi:hypothetical protein